VGSSAIRPSCGSGMSRLSGPVIEPAARPTNGAGTASEACSSGQRQPGVEVGDRWGPLLVSGISSFLQRRFGGSSEALCTWEWSQSWMESCARDADRLLAAGAVGVRPAGRGRRKHRPDGLGRDLGSIGRSLLRMSQLGGRARPDMPGADPPTASAHRCPVGTTAFCGSGSGNTKPVAGSAMTAAARR
jgi:hypothetical protein